MVDIIDQLVTTLEGWSNGKLPDGHILWGKSMVFWGRTGKFMQFAAGLAVVLDLIGPEKILEWGEKAGGYDWAEVRRRFGEELEKYRKRRGFYARNEYLFKALSPALSSYGWSEPGETTELLKAEAERSKRLRELTAQEPGIQVANRVIGFIYIALFVALVILLQVLVSWSSASKAAVGVLFAVSMLLFICLATIAHHRPAVYIFLAYIVAIAIRSVYSLFILGFAKLLVLLLGRGRPGIPPRPGHPVRVIAVIIGALGFMLDILAS